MKKSIFILTFIIPISSTFAEGFPTPPCISPASIESRKKPFCIGDICTKGHCSLHDLWFFPDGNVEIGKGCHSNNHIVLRGKWVKEAEKLRFSAIYTETLQKCIDDSKKGPGFVSEADSKQMCKEFFKKYTSADFVVFKVDGAVQIAPNGAVSITAGYYLDDKPLNSPIADYINDIHNLKQQCIREVR